MLSFKDYLKEWVLTEAKASHFAHISGFNPENPEHKDLVDAFNKSGKATKDAAKIKTLDQFKSEVAPHLEQIHKEKQHEAEDNAAIARGDAELVHHDPENGVKVYKVRNQRGGCAVGKGTKWCIANRETKDDMVKQYDPSGEDSHVIHLDKEKGNLSRIGIIGVGPAQEHTAGAGGNFQDKGNVTVTDNDWNRVRKQYKLDKIPALAGIRGIPITKSQMHKRITDRLDHINPSIRIKAIGHPDATSEHVDKALNDKDDNVRAMAAGHRSASLVALNKALNDPSANVRAGAAGNKNATSEHISKALGDKDKKVRLSAIRNPNATSEHISKALNDSSADVRYSAVSHPKATSEHLNKVINDPNEESEIKDLAKNKLKEKENK